MYVLASVVELISYYGVKSLKNSILEKVAAYICTKTVPSRFMYKREKL